MDEIGVGSIVKDKCGQLFLVVEERDDCIPSLFTLKSLKNGFSVITALEDEDFFTKVA